MIQTFFNSRIWVTSVFYHLILNGLFLQAEMQSSFSKVDRTHYYRQLFCISMGRFYMAYGECPWPYCWQSANNIL